MPFDLVRIDGAPDQLCSRYFLLEALRLCAPHGLILVERCDLPHVNQGVLEVVAAGAAHVAEVAGWTHHPAQTLLRVGRRVAGRKEPARIILVAVSGQGVRREWAISRPRVAAYAARVGASLVEFTDTLAPPMSLLAKLVALDQLNQQGRVLLLDTDIVIRDNAPDLFEIVPVDAVGVFLEGQVVERGNDLRSAMSHYGCDAIGPYYANTGVLLLPRELVAGFTLSAVSDVLHIDHLYEQGYFNALLHRLGFPVFNISPLFNCMPAVTPWCREQAFFIHFAGGSLGVRQPKIWDEASVPDAGCALLVQRDHSAKEARLFDIRNEIRCSEGPLDQIVSTSHLMSAGGLLLSREGVAVLRVPACRDLAVWGFYLDMVPGVYEVTILLAAASFREAFWTGSTPEPWLSLAGDALPPSMPEVIELDLLSGGGEGVLVGLREVAVVDGQARLSFTLERPTAGVECRLYGRGEVLDLYGVWFRRIGPAGTCALR